MANSSAILKQSDLTRYAKAMRAAGIPDFRVDIFPNGIVSIVAGQQPNGQVNGPDPDDLLR
jgi:hypothetical protein